MGSIARDALDQTVLLASVNDPEAAALIRELQEITDNDRYQFCERIRTLKAILAKLRPEPKREPLPPPKHYEPPRSDRRR
jgi:hypothetical protein